MLTLSPFHTRSLGASNSDVSMYYVYPTHPSPHTIPNDVSNVPKIIYKYPYT